MSTRIGKAVVVWVVVFFTAVDPVSAGRLFGRRACAPSYQSCGGSYGSSYSTCGSSYASCGGYSSCGNSFSSCGGSSNCGSSFSSCGPSFSSCSSCGVTDCTGTSQSYTPSVPSAPSLTPMPPSNVPPSTRPAAPSFPAPGIDTMPRDVQPTLPAPGRSTTPPPVEPAPAFDEDLPTPTNPRTTPRDEGLFDEAPARPRSTPPGELDDLFPEPTRPATPPPVRPSSPADDLFNQNAPRVPGERVAALIASDQELTWLFGELPPKSSQQAEPEQLPEPIAAPASLADNDGMRRWVDNTGAFSVNARLVVVGGDSVRLLKDTGKYTTVAIERLSSADQDFVRQHTVPTLAGR